MILNRGFPVQKTGNNIAFLYKTINIDTFRLYQPFKDKTTRTTNKILPDDGYISRNPGRIIFQVDHIIISAKR